MASSAEPSTRKRLSERDLRRVEAWARKSNLHMMISFFEGQPRKIEIPRPLFLGTIGPVRVFVKGNAKRSSVIGEISNLDEPLNPHAFVQRVTEMVVREKPLKAEIFGTLRTELRKGFSRFCYAQATGNCNDEFIRSHAVQESLLRTVAVDGHLLEFNPLGQTNPETRSWPRKIGVDEATTFTGFCAHHDNEIFKPIEGSTFSASPEALFLYAYRALCSDLYTMEVKFEVLKKPIAAVRGLETGESMRTSDSAIEANQRSVQELSSIKKAWDGRLAARDFDRLEHLVLLCPKTPSLFVTAFFAPRKDFRYRIVQDTRSSGALEWIALTVVPLVGGGGVAILSGERPSRVFKQFADSLQEYEPSKMTMALVNYILPNFGSAIIAPAWWNALTLEQQETVVRVSEAGYYPRHVHSLCDWGDFKPCRLP
jgi:hypothetical protein